MVKNGQGFEDHGTLKSDASHKWFDELSRLFEWFFSIDSDGMVFYSVSLIFILYLFFPYGSQSSQII